MRRFPSSARLLALGLSAPALLATGCGAGIPESGSPDTPSSAPSGGHSAHHPTRTPEGASPVVARGEGVTIKVARGRVVDRTGPSEVPLGETVRLLVDCDPADEVHVHGYDASAPCAPDKVAAITFTADIPGVFEVELEHAGLALMDLTVR